jgi:hypothetical protein
VRMDDKPGNGQRASGFHESTAGRNAITDICCHARISRKA